MLDVCKGVLVSPLEGVYYILEIEKKTMLAHSLNWINPKKGDSPSFHTPYPCSPQPNHYFLLYSTVDTGRKLNVHKTFRRCPGRLLNALLRSIYVLCLRGQLRHQNKPPNSNKPTLFFHC